MSEIMSSDEFLEHHGVKGMKWGVRKDRSGSSSNSSKSDSSASKDSSSKTEVYKDLARKQESKTVSKSEQTKNLLENEKKFLAKMDESVGDSKKGLTDGQKKAIYVGVGAVAVVGVLGGAYYLKKTNALNNIGSFNADDFQMSVKKAKLNTWGKDNYIKPSSFDRKAFTLSEGHTFHRISTVAEDSFKASTYATSNMDDFNRYLVGFRGELGSKKLKHITFQARKEIKVPSLTDIFDTLETSGISDGPENSMEIWQSLSGESWGNDSLGTEVMSALRKKGYSAFIDEMDAGVIGESPLVIIDPDAFTPKVAKAIKKNDIKRASRQVTKPKNMKLAA